MLTQHELFSSWPHKYRLDQEFLTSTQQPGLDLDLSGKFDAFASSDAAMKNDIHLVRTVVRPASHHAADASFNSTNPQSN